MVQEFHLSARDFGRVRRLISTYAGIWLHDRKQDMVRNRLSGRLRATVNPLRQLDRSVGFAEAFLRGGVANFIGTWWPVSDEAASTFAAALYKDLAKGESIGEALRAARSAVRGLPSADWANYLHYGSYDFTLKAPKG